MKPESRYHTNKHYRKHRPGLDHLRHLKGETGRKIHKHPLPRPVELVTPPEEIHPTRTATRRDHVERAALSVALAALDFEVTTGAQVLNHILSPQQTISEGNPSAAAIINTGEFSTGMLTTRMGTTLAVVGLSLLLTETNKEKLRFVGDRVINTSAIVNGGIVGWNLLQIGLAIAAQAKII